MPPARNHRSAHGALALVAAVLLLAGNSCAFVVVVVGPRRPRGCCLNPIIVGSSTNDDDGGDVFFDDFGDGFADGGGPSPQLSGLLRTRMVEVRGAEAAYDAKLARNWRRGNWSVRGFSLDKSPASSSAAAADVKADGSAVVRVSVVAAPTSSSRDADISLPQDRDLTVAVGRTDGSVFVVKLGDEYLTNFVADGGNVGKETDGAGMARLGGGVPRADESDSDDRTTTAQRRAPFEIKHQFLASDRGEPIHGLVFHDSIEASDECGGIICTAAGTSGDISMWKLPYHDEGITQATVLSGVHGDQIVSLKTMVLKPRGEDMDERNVLFSASEDGTFALWNLDGNGELILSCQSTDVDDGTTTCADVFNPSSWDDGYGYNGESDNDVIFFGTSSGYVFGYVLQELLPPSFETGGNSNIESVNASPNIRFRAHGTESGKGEAVTAIKCGGDGTIPTTARSSSPTLSSSILLTGGEDGSVKQWEILSQKTQSSPASVRMEHWPRMSSQRMKRRAHIFTPPHDGPVTCISQQGRQDSSKFLTSGKDGSVCVWSASSGKELFRMDGFSTVSSLACLGRELLVTNGMDEYVCVHDFGIAEDAASNGYELEW